VPKLFKTYIDMLALRSGPDDIPHSWTIFSFAVGMLIFSSFCASLIIDGDRDQDYVITYAGYLLALAFYSAVLIINGFMRRMLQTLSAIVVCGALITLLYVGVFVIFRALIGDELAGFVGLLIILWSVPVEGHIIAKAINRHWFVGITIAVVALLLQIQFQSVMAGGT
jgi:hypothetical protein